MFALCRFSCTDNSGTGFLGSGGEAPASCPPSTLVWVFEVSSISHLPMRLPFCQSSGLPSLAHLGSSYVSSRSAEFLAQVFGAPCWNSIMHTLRKFKSLGAVKFFSGSFGAETAETSRFQRASFRDLLVHDSVFLSLSSKQRYSGILFSVCAFLPSGIVLGRLVTTCSFLLSSPFPF